MREYIPVALDNLIKASQDEVIIRRLIADIVNDPTGHEGGLLTYKGNRYREYKSGGLRVFAVIYNDAVVIAMFGRHKDKNYIGATYDGTDKFSVTYNNAAMTPAQEFANSSNVVKKIYGINNSASPEPIFD